MTDLEECFQSSLQFKPIFMAFMAFNRVCFFFLFNEIERDLEVDAAQETKTEGTVRGVCEINIYLFWFILPKKLSKGAHYTTFNLYQTGYALLDRGRHTMLSQVLCHGEITDV